MLNYTIDIVDEIAIVELDGTFNFSSIDKFKSELNKKIIEKELDCILNFVGVNYMDSSGIGLLMDIKKKLTRAKKDVVLINLRDEIKKVLNMVRILEFFDIYEDLEKAKAFINKK